VQGSDVNHPGDVIEIPTSFIMTINRCWSQPFVVNHPTYGSFTIDLRPDGIIGSCNQCGMCCAHPADTCQWGSLEACGYILIPQLNIHACQHLIIDKTNKWGQANNTECELYANILDYYKGCAYPPKAIDPWWTGCGFSFP